MPLINKIHLHQALTATLLQHNQFVTPITRQYKVSGINLKKTAPNYLLNLLIKSSIPEQFHLLATGKLDAIKSVNLTEDKVNCSLSYKRLSDYIHQDFSQQLCHPKTH